MKKKKRAKVKLHRVVKMKPTAHLVEIEVAGAPPPEVVAQAIITKPSKKWADWLLDKLSGA